MLHQVLALGHLHFRLRELLFGLLLLEHLLDLTLQLLCFRGVAVSDARVDHAAGDLGPLRLACFHGCLDDLAVWFGGYCACAAGAAGTSRSSYSVQVDFVALGCFVVDDCFDALDVQTTRGEVGGEEEGDIAVTEVFDAFNTLRIFCYSYVSLGKAVDGRRVGG